MVGLQKMNISRTNRQKSAVNKWIAAKGIGTIIAVTGFGKTNMAIMAIQRYIKKYNNHKVLIVVPTIVLQQQWQKILQINHLEACCKVNVINTVIKYDWDYEFLILDECHRFASLEFRKVFTCVKYERLLCLTATLKRLDGLDKIIEHYAPVCDNISIQECIINKWISDYKEYKILIDVDLTEYESINKEFYKYFAFFNYDLNIALECVKHPFKQNLMSKKLGIPLAIVKANTYSFMRALRARKNWVINHPKKLEIAKRILDARKDKKILTFSSSVKLALCLGPGEVIHYKVKAKARSEILTKFNNLKTGVLHSVDALREGLDVRNVSVAIIVGYNSSTLKKVQTIGRVIRKEGDKQAEIFTLVLKNTMEENWFSKSSEDKDYITLEEDDLNNLLNNSSTKKENSLYII